MFVIRNVPTFAYGMSYGDAVNAKTEDGVLVFDGVAERGGRSTYRAYTKFARMSSEMAQVLQSLEKSRCEIEPAMNKIVVGIDADVAKGWDAIHVLLSEIRERTEGFSQADGDLRQRCGTGD